MSKKFNDPFSKGLSNSGRPRKYKTSKEIEDVITSYFEDCFNSKEKITITGLALALGFESRQSIYDYSKNTEFSYIIKRAQLRVEHSYELSGNTIDIFALKQMSWKDSKDVDITSKGDKISNLSSLSTEELIERAKIVNKINEQA